MDSNKYIKIAYINNKRYNLVFTELKGQHLAHNIATDIRGKDVISFN